jgi:hypothetical protein
MRQPGSESVANGVLCVVMVDMFCDSPTACGAQQAKMPRHVNSEKWLPFYSFGWASRVPKVLRMGCCVCGDGGRVWRPADSSVVPDKRKCQGMSIAKNGCHFIRGFIRAL